MTQFNLQKFKEIETPFFYYDESLLRETLKIIKSESDKHQFHVHYALKANANNRILELENKLESLNEFVKSFSK